MRPILGDRTTPSSSLWSRPAAAALVFATAFAITAPFAARRQPSYDGFIMTQVAISIGEDGTPLVHPIDRFGLNFPYSGYGIGNSVVMAGLYKVAVSADIDPIKPMRLANPLIYAATVTAVFVMLRRRGHPRGRVVLVTSLIAVGTPLFHYAIVDLSEPGVALAIALSLICLDASVGSRWGPYGLGLSCGLAVLFRSDSWLVVVLPMLVGAWIFGDRRLRPLGSVCLGLLPPGIAWAAYNEARFGSLTSSGYHHQPFSHPILTGLYGLIASPGHGIFVYVPLLIVAIAAVLFATGSARTVGAIATAMLMLRLVLYSRWWSWYGGNSWGPRFMVPVLPAFAPAIADAFERWRRRWFTLLASVCTLAMGIVGFAVATGALPFVYSQASRNFDEVDRLPVRQKASYIVGQWTSDAFVDATDSIMFDWSRFPARRR